MRAVGDEWEAGRLNEAQEHIVSNALISFLLPRVTNSLAHKHAPAMVFSTFPEERHQMGLLFFAALASARNIRCYYLGADLPATATAQSAIAVNAAVTTISVVNKISKPKLLSRIENLRGHLPEDRKIWIGGHAAGVLKSGGLPPNCFVLASSDESIQCLNQFALTPAG